MKVSYANATLERCATDLKRAERQWKTSGVAEAYYNRVPVLMAIDNLEELHLFQGFDFHPLHGDREGQYAITLEGLWRLIFEHSPDDDEIIIVEVKDYHP